MSSNSESTGAILAALFANLAIAAVKTVGAILSGSASLLAEAIHSYVDCANQFLLLVGQKASKKPPSDSHPLGYGREAFFWSFIVAILLFSMGGVFSIYEGVHKLGVNEPLESPGLSLAILVAAIALESYALVACLKQIKLHNPYGSLWKWFRKTTNSELLVLLTEDLAAICGLALATCAISIAWLTENPMWDALGSVLIGLLLCSVTVLLGVEIKSLIIGEAPNRELRDQLQNIFSSHLSDSEILRFLALQTGSNEVLVSLKIKPGNIANVKELIERINSAEKEVKLKHPEIKWLFVEPDYYA
ncbi:MAG: cation diffusion facilitator family transporter [Bdellovibrionota bacterium]